MGNVIHENFKTLNGALLAMEERAPNKAFTNARHSSQRIDDGFFSGVSTYDEAMTVIRNGYSDPLERMKKAILKIGESNKDTRPRSKNDYVGFMPNVPNALMNLPISMINRERVPQKQRSIHLVYSFTAHARISSSDLIKGGINFISLVNMLEKQGYRVKIDVLCCVVSRNRKTTLAFTCNVKEYGQSLNLLKLAFPLVHPAMLRRVVFKWIETVPNLTDKSFVDGYGIPLGVTVKQEAQHERNFYVANKIFSRDVFYCNVFQAFNSTSVEELCEKMGLSN